MVRQNRPLVVLEISLVLMGLRIHALFGAGDGGCTGRVVVILMVLSSLLWSGAIMVVPMWSFKGFNPGFVPLPSRVHLPLHCAPAAAVVFLRCDLRPMRTQGSLKLC